MSFWRQLAQERELRGVSLEEVAERTKISRTTLDLMESGDPKRLPARAYLLGYLRSYAEAVGLDAEDVLLRFEEQAGAADDSGEMLVPESGPKRAGLRLLLWALLGLLLAAGAMALWVLAGS